MAKAKKKNSPTVSTEVNYGELTKVTNSLSEFVTSLAYPASGPMMPWGSQWPQEQLSKLDTAARNVNLAPITLQWQILSALHSSIGYARNIIDCPANDGFGGHIKLDVSGKHKKMTLAKWEEEGDQRTFIQALIYARLYGGSIIIATDGDCTTPLPKGYAGSFEVYSRWDIGNEHNEIDRNMLGILTLAGKTFQIGGLIVHPTRAIILPGRIAPGLIRQTLMGWGLSELECCIRSLNVLLKFEASIFELIDEAKVSVLGYEGLTAQLLSGDGTQKLIQMCQLIASLKNNKSLLLMGSEDKFDQKQISWTGLNDLWDQARYEVCSESQMPYNILCGSSATGWASGNDSLENYYRKIENEVRNPYLPYLKSFIKMRAGSDANVDVYLPQLRPAKIEEDGRRKQRIVDAAVAAVRSGIITQKEARQWLSRDIGTLEDLPSNNSELPDIDDVLGGSESSLQSSGRTQSDTD